MIKKITRAAAILSLLIVISINSFGQRGLTSSVPTLRFTTAGGEKIITVSNIDGIVTKGRVMKGLVPATGFIVTGGIRQEDRLPVSVVVDKTTTSFSGYRLELLINKTWKQVPVAINVVRPPQESLLLVSQGEKKPAPPKSGLEELVDAENNVLNISRQLLLKQKINEAIKNRNVFRHKNAPEIKDWFPKDTGAIAGTFILVGKNLDSVTALTLGTTVLPIIKRIKNPSFEAVIVQLPAAQLSGTVSFTYPVGIGGSRTTVTLPVDENYALVDPFSALWPSTRATVINITPTPDYADKPHALKQYTYSILYEYVPGNVVSKYEWKNSTLVPSAFIDRSSFRPAHDFGMGIGGEQFTGSGAPDASGGTFITANMFVGTITGTIRSVANTDRPFSDREITTATARINTEISSYLNTNSQAQEIKHSLTKAEFEYNTPRSYTINNTHAIRDVFDFDLFYSHGTTQGVSTGESDVNVGMLNVESDLAFRIASGPVGTEAVWISKPFIMSDGWRVTRFNWNERLVFPDNTARAHAQHFNTLTLYQALFGNILRDIEGCRNYTVYRSICNNPRYDYHSKDVDDGSFSFQYDPEQAGESLTCNPVMRADPNGYRGHLDRQNIKGAFINLKASNTLTNDHRVTLVLESIELLGPRGGSSSTAFSNIVRYEPLLSPTSGHIIGIVYPEFFQLLGN
ncbi:MAG TPA: hypothetical protein VGO58_06735 [Chitinophagaceae bacterium]|jgi:hypothetical protein|nr:hypothetical protein [Chitinophagaceae bacterium]